MGGLHGGRAVQCRTRRAMRAAASQPMRRLPATLLMALLLPANCTGCETYELTGHAMC